MLAYLPDSWLKKQVPVLVGVRKTMVSVVGALDVCLRAKLKFNKQLLPLSIIRPPHISAALIRAQTRLS